MPSVLQPSRLTWRETVRRFSHYSLGVAALWAVAIALYLTLAPAPHWPSSRADAGERSREAVHQP